MQTSLCFPKKFQHVRPLAVSTLTYFEREFDEFIGLRFRHTGVFLGGVPMTKTFKTGDIVVLKSQNSPQMTVHADTRSVTPHHNNKVCCVYFKDDALVEVWLLPGVLKSAESSEKFQININVP